MQVTGFLAQDSRPTYLAEGSVASLLPPQRLLLLCDGSVSMLLTAYYLEDILVHTRLDASNHQNPWGLSVLTCHASEVVERSVLLVGAASGVTYVEATSLLDPGKMPAHLMDEIRQHPQGIGGALRDGELPVFRRWLWWGCVPPSSDQADSSPLSVERAYVICSVAGAFAYIHERFN